jgi:hypothetical protein
VHRRQHAIDRRAAAGIAALAQPADGEALAQREGMAEAAAVAVGRGDPDIVADQARGALQVREARRVDAVAVAQQDTQGPPLLAGAPPRRRGGLPGRSGGWTALRFFARLSFALNLCAI